MPRATKEQVLHRRDEILDACDELYRESSFKEVTIKGIAARTSFSRPSIYNYFQTIEEIFLGLLQREYERWAVELEQIRDGGEQLDVEGLACAIAHSLEGHASLLRLQSMNLYEIEENSRIERLTDFKLAFKRALAAFDGCVAACLPDKDEEYRRKLCLAFFPFLYGVFPYSEPTCKQCQAMDAAGVPHAQTSIYDIVRNCLELLLK